MVRSGAGYEFPPAEVSWKKRDVLLFANSIGATADELHFLYVRGTPSLYTINQPFLSFTEFPIYIQKEFHPNFAVFPTYPLILPFKLTDQEVTNFLARKTSQSNSIPGLPRFDFSTAVDGQRKLTVLKPLPTSSSSGSNGKKFELRNKVLGVYDKGEKAGTVIETEQLIVERGSGEVYSRVASTEYLVGQGGWGGDRGPSSVKYSMPQRKPDAVNVVQTNMETAHLYRLNGDYNPLHATPEPGKELGFGGIIIHGLFTWSSTAHGVLRTFGNSDPGRLKQLQARFARAVRPGDRLVTSMWKIQTNEGEDGLEEIRFETSNGDGQVVLSNGRALLGKSRLLEAKL